MKFSRRAVLLGVGGLALAAAAVWLFATRGPLAPTGVETTVVSRGELRPTVFGIGTVEARHVYAVGPIQAGRLLRVSVDEGDRVEAGQVLAEIDPVDLDQRAAAAALAVARAQEAVRAARAQVVETESRVRVAQANRARYQSLYRQNFVSREMADSRAYEATAAEAGLAAASANAEAAVREAGRAAAERAGTDRLRESLKLRSPVDGVVVAREAEPGATVVAGQAVLRLVDPARLWVRARVDQARAADVHTGQPAVIVLRSAPGTALPATVSRIEWQSDALTEERIVNVAFDPVPARLHLGELAEVTIRLPGADDTLRLPRAALAQHKGRHGVWRIESGRARFQPVQPGRSTDTEVEIVSGLTAGETVIVYSASQLEEGMRVREQTLTRP